MKLTISDKYILVLENCLVNEHKLKNHQISDLKGNLNKMNIRVITQEGKVVGVSIFNRAFLKSQLTVGTSITVFGKYDRTKNINTSTKNKKFFI